MLAEYSSQVVEKLDVAPPYVPTPYDLVAINLRLVLSGRIQTPAPDDYLTYRQGLTSRAFSQ